MSVFRTCFTSSGVARVKQEESTQCQYVPSRHLFGGLKGTVDVSTKIPNVGNRGFGSHWSMHIRMS